jgi:hypothetical protein
MGTTACDTRSIGAAQLSGKKQDLDERVDDFNKGRLTKLSCGRTRVPEAGTRSSLRLPAPHHVSSMCAERGGGGFA